MRILVGSALNGEGVAIISEDLIKYSVKLEAPKQ